MTLPDAHLRTITRPELPLDLAKIRHVHLVGICGTGMGTLAGMLKAKGFHVTGSDDAIYPPMSTQLEAWGIGIKKGFSPGNLEPTPDLTIIGNVCRPQNPEAAAVRERHLPALSLPGALAEIFIRDRHSLTVCGTHGKTTTTALCGYLLYSAGLNPGLMVGGIARNFNSSFLPGTGPYFVVEGDEYDSAFFEKFPKFMHYRPRTAILTSVEFDHIDIYPEPESYRRAFYGLMELLPPDGHLVVCADQSDALAISKAAACSNTRYGFAAGAMVRISEPDPVMAGQGPPSVAFQLSGKTATGADVSGEYRLGLGGRHNVSNAAAAICAAASMGVAVEDIRKFLPGFIGCKRRQEVLGEPRGITVIDDFAHHPTAVRETIAALRMLYGPRRLLVAFEPRTNTSRNRVFQAPYAGAFDGADLTIIATPAGARELGDEISFSASELAHDLRARGLDAHAISNTAEIAAFLAQMARPGDVIAIMSNGGFGGLHTQLLALLAS